MTPEQRAARIHYHMYDTCEGIAEHAERIVRLEELVVELYEDLDGLIGDDTLVADRGRSRWLLDKNDVTRYRVRMSDLGIDG